ncbi:hypothetical protein KBTX_02557 [wastewater metagenome]|uniref:DUF2237 domain-containing protein n=2 Tax=unclassified sequences TaxID=12908 RepID=A0A5B8RHM9_9ZZZZ|nr:DUF2237 domain-containing protein [Arhodomonas sp. KWT]QEA06227.1 hypothetical protein KBTEX_02557 [uncultured organism]
MPETRRNVLGTTLDACCSDPVTGFYRDGYCRVGADDAGVHAVCATLTDEFLAFSARRGNDLSTPRPEFGFDGLSAGDQWCLCAARWLEAHEAGCATRVRLLASDEAALEVVALETLKPYALDLS